MHLRLFTSAVLLLSATVAAQADTYTTFDINATLQYGSLTGTLTLDLTPSPCSCGESTGPVDISVISGTVGNFALTSAGEQSDTPGSPGVADTEIALDDSTTSQQLFLFLPLSSLTGYAGSDLCSLNNLCLFGYSFAVNIFANADDKVISGTLTPAAAAPTPEPSPVALVGTGLLGCLLAHRRRHRQPCPAQNLTHVSI